MNKQELKKILKPLIKECIKEVMFEDGVLSSVISEVMIAADPSGRREKIQETTLLPKTPNVDMNKLKGQRNQKLQEQRKQMLDVIGKDAFNGVNVFEGITPTPSPQASGQGPLADTAPNDPGIDISNFAKADVWKKLAGN